MARPEAKSALDSDRSIEPERSSPMGLAIGLVVAFVVLAGIGVVTVVIPEVTDDGEADEPAAATEDEAAPERGDDPGASAPQAPGPPPTP